MRKRWACLLFFPILLFMAVPAGADVPETLRIIGAVKQPLQLTLNDLSRFQSVPVRLNELTRDKKFPRRFQLPRGPA